MTTRSDDRLAAALVRVAAAAPVDADDWWVIGSTALLLSGIESVEPADVDVIASASTATRLLHAWSVPPRSPAAGERLRSRPYAQVELPGCCPIDVMGDLEVRTARGWEPVRPRTRHAIVVAGATVFVPSLEEQAVILARFDRPKDHARIALIDRHVAHVTCGETRRRVDRPS